jgi:hypothetical protein
VCADIIGYYYNLPLARYVQGILSAANNNGRNKMDKKALRLFKQIAHSKIDIEFALKGVDWMHKENRSSEVNLAYELVVKALAEMYIAIELVAPSNLIKTSLKIKQQ